MHPGAKRRIIGVRLRVSRRRRHQRTEKARRHGQPARWIESAWPTDSAQPIEKRAVATPPRVAMRQASRVERLAYTRSQQRKRLVSAPPLCADYCHTSRRSSSPGAAHSFPSTNSNASSPNFDERHAHLPREPFAVAHPTSSPNSPSESEANEPPARVSAASPPTSTQPQRRPHKAESVGGLQPFEPSCSALTRPPTRAEHRAPKCGSNASRDAATYAQSRRP